MSLIFRKILGRKLTSDEVDGNFKHLEDTKVTKVDGEGLSPEKFTLKEKLKLAGLINYVLPQFLANIDQTDIDTWNDAKNKKIKTFTITGDANKTAKITFADGSALQANFEDIGTSSDIKLNSFHFNLTTGVATAVTSDGNTITASFDGRYSLLNHSHAISEISGLVAELEKKITINPEGDKNKFFNELGQPVTILQGTSPSFTVDNVLPSAFTNDGTTHRITIFGSLLDTINEVNVVPSVNATGVSISIVSQTSSKIEADIIINTVNQSYDIKLHSIREVKIAKTYQTPNVFTIVPKLSGAAYETWVKPAITGNSATIGNGSYKAGSTSDGFNDYAYFGKIIAQNSIEFEFVPNYVSSPYIFIVFSESQTHDTNVKGGFLRINGNNYMVGYNTGSSRAYSSAHYHDATYSKKYKIIITKTRLTVQALKSDGTIYASKYYNLPVGEVLNIASGLFLNFVGVVNFSAINLKVKAIS